MNTKKFIYKSTGKFINATAAIFPKWNRECSFKLLCKVNRVGITDKGKKFFARGKTTFFKIENQKVALHKWGTGSKNVLFIHGWMSNAQRWQPYVEGLDLTEYTAYALDAQGHGLSEGKSLNVEAYRQAVEKAIRIIGNVETITAHSLGSMVTAYLYLVHPTSNVQRFIIMGAPAGMDAIFNYFKVMLGLSERAIDNLLIKANTILKIPAKQVSVIDFFKKVNHPTLVIHEKTDVVTPFGPIENGVKQNSNIQTYFTEGLGHNLESDNVVKYVLDYIDTPIKQPQLQD